MSAKAAQGDLHEILLCPAPHLDALPSLVAPLLAWYRENARILPWRENTDPYRVWVSEIMLQQTRVEAVKEYYRRFLHTLPTVADLAAADEPALLKLWEGLGYYSRARNLQKAAKAVMERYGGALPASYAELLTLPGIGEYTAGAVASIAFGIPVPAVDGNVYRVISRVLGSYADTSRPPVKAGFRRAVAGIVPENAPGDFNQALMELGATVCVPGAPPLCGGCPVAPLCSARQGGYATELPVKPGKKPRRIEQRTILLLLSEQGLLLFRRPQTGLLAGLLEPLNLEGHLDPDGAAGHIRALGGEATQLFPLAAAKHIFSHVEWRMQGYLAFCSPFSPTRGIWADREALLHEHAVPSAFSAFFRDIDRYFSMLGERDGAAQGVDSSPE